MNPSEPRPTSDPADEFPLRPLDCPSREQWSARLEPPPQPVLPPAEPPRRPQFSVGEVMIVMVGVAVGLAGGTWMPADIFAASLGLVTLFGLLVVHMHPPESRLAKLIWATLVLAYVMAVFAALLKPVVA
ncbi:MAG: hypothetical protein SFU86_05120 [Pirellulaceae bacterium]|nr:hypothetical protein [Pirellulaceae bacterium]